MNDAADSPLPAALIESTQAQFVAWLRDVAPYVHAHRGRTFVIGIAGELIEAGRLNALVHDLSLLHALGIKLAPSGRDGGHFRPHRRRRPSPQSRLCAKSPETRTNRRTLTEILHTLSG